MNDSLAILAASGINCFQDFLRGILTAILLQQVVQITIFLRFLYIFPYFSYSGIVANDKSKNISLYLGMLEEPQLRTLKSHPNPESFVKTCFWRILSPAADSFMCCCSWQTGPPLPFRGIIIIFSLGNPCSWERDEPVLAICSASSVGSSYFSSLSIQVQV